MRVITRNGAIRRGGSQAAQQRMARSRRLQQHVSAARARRDAHEMALPLAVGFDAAPAR